MPRRGAESYLRAVFEFTGVTDIAFINAQPMDAMGEQLGKAKIEESKQEAIRLADRI